VANSRLKVVEFSVNCEEFVRAANTGVTVSGFSVCCRGDRAGSEERRERITQRRGGHRGSAERTGESGWGRTTMRHVTTGDNRLSRVYCNAIRIAGQKIEKREVKSSRGGFAG
jgi:hypothetical protein